MMDYSTDTDDIITATANSAFTNANVSLIRESSSVMEQRRVPPPPFSRAAVSASSSSTASTAAVPTDPPADLPSRHEESIILTADGIQQQQARWNQLQQQRQSKRPETRMLSIAASPLVGSRSTDGLTTTTTTGEPQYYATLEDVQSISVCSELSTTFVGSGSGVGGGDGTTSFLSIPNHHPIDTSSITASNDPSLFGNTNQSNHEETSVLTEQQSNIRYPSNRNHQPLHTYNNIDNTGFNIDDYDLEDDHINDNRTNPSLRTVPIPETDIENSAIPPPTSPPDRQVIANDYQNTSGIRNGNKRCRLIAIIVILFWAIICTVAVAGVVCGMGNCSKQNNAASNTSGNGIMNVGNNTVNNGTVADGDGVERDDPLGIKSYLRSISLTNISLGGSGMNDDDILKQVDEMAMNWIVREYTPSTNNTNNANTIMNVTDPISQQRLQQLFAIVTLYFSTNGLNWTVTTNWLQSQIHECEWYGITCYVKISISNMNDIDNSESYNDHSTVIQKLQFPGIDDNFIQNGTNDIENNIISVGNNTTNPTASGAAILSPTIAPTSLRTSIQPTYVPTAVPITMLPSLASASPPPFILPSSAPPTAPLTLGIPPIAATAPVDVPTTPSPSTLSAAAPITTTPSLSPSSSYLSINSIALPMNNLVGPINPNIGLLTDLKLLDLSNNKLTGTIPASLSQCSNLVRFKVDNNSLTGTIPKEIVPFWSDSIINFNVGSNRLTGTIPENIGFWNKIRLFAIDTNRMNGTIPTTIQYWTNVENVQFENNQLSGTIPAGFCSFVNQSDATVIVDQYEVDCACCDNQSITMYVP